MKYRLLVSTVNSSSVKKLMTCLLFSGWRTSFGDNEDSGSSSSTPTTSPRTGGVSDASDFLWTSAPVLTLVLA